MAVGFKPLKQLTFFLIARLVKRGIRFVCYEDPLSFKRGEFNLLRKNGLLTKHGGNNK